MPSEKQIAYGNYPKGHKYVSGMRVSVENAAGSVRKGKDKDGAEWEQKLQHDYGYIRGTTGRDKDHIDVFLGPDAKNADLPVHVIDQVDHHSGDFDEHKVVLGAKDADEAAQVYHANYSPGWRGLGEVTPTDLGTFKKWAFDGARKVKPFSELALHQQERVGYKAGGVVRRKGYDDGGSVGGDGVGADPGDSAGVTGDGTVGNPGDNGSGIGSGAAVGNPGADSDSNNNSSSDNGISLGNIASMVGMAVPSIGQIGSIANMANQAIQGNVAPAITGVVSGLAGIPAAVVGPAVSAVMGQPVNNASFDDAVISSNPIGMIANMASLGLTGQSIGQSLAGIPPGPSGNVSPEGSVAGHEPDGGSGGGTPTVDGSDAAAWERNRTNSNNAYLGGLGYTNWGSGLQRYSLKEGGRVGYGGGGHVAAENAPGFWESLPHVLDGPAATLRGLTAGTLGLPGDVEGMVSEVAPYTPQGMLLKALGGLKEGRDTTPMLPTSQFFHDWLPASGTVADNTYGELGRQGAVTPFSAVRGAQAVSKGAVQAAKLLGKEALRPLDAAMQGEGALSQLFAPAAASRAYAVKPKGGNWTSSPGGGNPEHLVDSLGADHLTKTTLDWANKKIPAYIKTYLGAAEDPLLQLEKSGNLHVDEESIHNLLNDQGLRANEQGVVQGPRSTDDPFWVEHRALTGRNYKTPWEAVADAYLDHRSPAEELRDAKEFSNWGESRPGPETTLDELMAGNPGNAYLGKYKWLEKADPNTRIHEITGGDPLQFGHVLDYLHQATRAGKGREALLRGLFDAEAFNPAEATQLRALVDRGLDIHPDKLPMVSVPDAVRNTSEWNKMLASAKNAGDLNKGIKQVHKTYDTGHQWVELAPEGLDAEGKAMRHCVGGYCSSVEDGSTRILSLRDKAGKPAVTVEVAKPNVLGSLSSEQKTAVSEQLGAPGHMGLYNPAAEETALKLFPELANLSPEIRQIKGPANRAPSKEVLAHVQDLVRGGVPGMEKWGRVRELHNAGLTDVRNVDRRTTIPWRNTVSQAEVDELMNTADKHWLASGSEEAHASPGDFMLDEFNKAHPGKQYVTPEEWTAWARAQYGKKGQ